MKVLFILGGLPHYEQEFFEKLSLTKNLEIIVLLPTSKSKSIGDHVYEVREANKSFQIIYGEEYLLFGQKSFFRNFIKILKETEPRIIVVGWPYILGLYLNLRVRNFLKKMDVKVCFRSIPYQFPPFHEAMKYYTKEGFYDEEMNHYKADTFFKKLKYWILAKINKRIFNWVDAHLTYSTKAFIIFPSYGVPKHKIFVTYNSIDTDKILEAQHQIDTDKFELPLAFHPYRLVHIGRLVKWKKVDLLLKVFAKVLEQFPTADILIIGDGKERDALEALANDLGIAKHVRFLGAIYDKVTIGSYLRSCSACVLVGAGGLVINEVMAWGKPVICSEADGTEVDLVIPKQTGLIFEKDNPIDLQEKIQYVFSNPQQAAEMGKNAQALIYNHINIHTVIINFITAFNTLTKNEYELVYQGKELRA